MGEKIEERHIAFKRLMLWLRFMITFLAFSVVLHLLIYLNVDLYWLRRLYVFCVYYSLKPFFSVIMQGTTVTTSFNGSTLMVNISDDCTGWKSLVALLALILSTPPSFIRSKKAYLFIFLTPLVVFFVTFIRILSSILFSILTSPQNFEFIHGILWKALSLLIAVGIWWWWVNANRREIESDEKGNDG